MNKELAADPQRERRTETLHTVWPPSAKQRLSRVAEMAGVSVTEVLLRVLARADESGVLLDWIKAGPASPRSADSPLRTA